MLKACDLDRDGCIQYEEFIGWVVEERPINPFSQKHFAIGDRVEFWSTREKTWKTDKCKIKDFNLDMSQVQLEYDSVNIDDWFDISRIRPRGVNDIG